MLRRWTPRSYVISGLVMMILSTLVTAVFAGVGWSVGRAAGTPVPGTGPSDSGPSGPAQARRQTLRWAGCATVVGPGQRDECVREVQVLLSGAGIPTKVTSTFGPETLQRVTAFQVLTDLPSSGVVDDRTMRALHSHQASITTWTSERVGRRIREVFSDDPDLAVRIARCESYLDPLWISLDADGSRRWGVFHLADGLLAEHGAPAKLALDPEWNITTAHRIWAETRDYRNWPACLDASASA